MKAYALMAMSVLLSGPLAAEVFACGGCGCAAPKKTAPKVEAAHNHGSVALVSTDELKQLIASGEDVVIVDARSGKWDDGKRIAGAKQLSAGASAEEIAAALPDKGAKIVAYCSNKKCPASKKLAHKLQDLGYTGVSKYPDGIQAWIAAGNAVSEQEK